MKPMNSIYLSKAKQLAKLAYQVHVFPDETTEGEPTLVAVVPEMPGCIAHGETIDEALEWLESAKVDHIWFLLDKGLPIPEPLGPDVRIETSDNAANAQMNSLETATVTPEPVA